MSRNKQFSCMDHSTRRATLQSLVLASFLLVGWLSARWVQATGLSAGVAKVDITNREAGPVESPLHVKALVLTSNTTTAVLITVDAVAIGEIGHVTNDYLPTVRSRLKQEFDVAPANVLINASHCHGVVCSDVAERTFQAVKQAVANMVPVEIGVGIGHEDRIMENRRLKLKSGGEADVRHAYAMPPDDQVTAIGPVDPEIGVLRLDRIDGRTLAVLYNFACHPIQGVPSGANTGDITGFASKVIEDTMSDGTIALFLQGCAGDINPAWYKNVNHPRDAEPLGNMLGLSTLKALRTVQTKADTRLRLLHDVIQLPRADLSERITAMEAKQQNLLQSLQGTSLNLKTFVHLLVKYRLSPDFPSYYSHGYLHEKAIGRDDLRKLDARNRGDMARYIRNVHTMEELTRLGTNLALLRKHQAENTVAEKPTIDVEMLGLRIGDFLLITFPGEPSVQVGLNIKKQSPHEQTFVAGYTNGYIYYAPTAEQLNNVGAAQEDSDCLLAPDWQALYEKQAVEMLKNL